MVSHLVRRRTAWLVMVIALLLGIAPFSAVSADFEASRTEVAFASSVVAVIDEGEEWVDDAGVFHFRGFIQEEELSGDISGTVIINFNGDLEPVGECTEESCPGFSSNWGRVEVTGEEGGWEGTYVNFGSDVPGEEFYADSLVLKGTGANAGKSIVASSVGGDEDSIEFEGVMSDLGGMATTGMNTNVLLCADPEDFSFAGGFLSTGSIEGGGAANGEFIVGGVEATHTYAVAGMMTLTDEHGSVTIAFGGGAQDTYTETFEASHVAGHFLILEGTGEYANLYGSGRVVATAGGPDPVCESGFSINASLIGETRAN